MLRLTLGLLAASALCLPAGAAHGFDGRSANMAEIVFGSGGPFRGVTPYRHHFTFEEFDKSLDDVDDVATPPAEWANSGWDTVAAQGGTVDTGDHLRSLGEGVLMVYAGTVAQRGILAQHNTRNRISGGVASFFRFPFYKWAVWQIADGLASYNLHFGAEIGVSATSSWASDALIGMAYPDTDDSIVATTGGVTCGRSWVGEGGAVFYIDRTQNLNLHVCSITGTQRTRTVSLASEMLDGGVALRVGYSYTTTGSLGRGTLQGYYQVAGAMEPIRWTRLGSAITGAVFPTASGPSLFTVEVQNGTSGAQQAVLVIEWTAGAVTKEGVVGEF
jgi:hypothetical protein